MDLFIQVKKAYDVLNDPQKRAIYDVVGMKGLKAEGWEVNEKYISIVNNIFIIDRLSVEQKPLVKFSKNMNDWHVNVKKNVLIK
jgi:DnaJ-class molecular chaperone